VAARAETPQEWITLGSRARRLQQLHSGGYSHRNRRLAAAHAKPREVTVVYYDSDKALCACTADGIAIATQATVGRRTFKISSESAPEGVAAMIVVRHKRTGQAVVYTVSDRWLPMLAERNRTLDGLRSSDEG
jgi:formylmethanofuran dehydrogenase subunit E